MSINIPSDPIILYSFINTMLRDRYASLQEFCIANNLDEKVIMERLASAGFEYDQGSNRFM